EWQLSILQRDRIADSLERAIVGARLVARRHTDHVEHVSVAQIRGGQGDVLLLTRDLRYVRELCDQSSPAADVRASPVALLTQVRVAACERLQQRLRVPLQVAIAALRDAELHAV